ncbi:MAG: hypothetical protein H7Y19_17725 [Luteimonas sp.]|nr:hypothetical protein [Luteimonas sp.]
MFIFSIRDMCVSSQAEAVLDAICHLDAHASVSINLVAHEVRIAPRTAGATALSDAITHAGFDPELQACARVMRGPGQAPPKIPFAGLDHDFTASPEVVER